MSHDRCHITGGRDDVVCSSVLLACDVSSVLRACVTSDVRPSMVTSVFLLLWQLIGWLVPSPQQQKW